MREIVKNVIRKFFPFVGVYRDFKNDNAGEISLSLCGYIKIKLGLGRHYAPIEKFCFIQHPERIYVGRHSKVFRWGGYYNGVGGIYLGDNVSIANFCTILTRNHDLYNHDIGHFKKVVIKDNCWLGTGAKILPGVELGPRTIVAAGAVVTKSFPDGYCVLAGVPARIIKTLNKEEVVSHKLDKAFYGALTPKEFEKLKSKYLSVDKDFFESEILDYNEYYKPKKR